MTVPKRIQSIRRQRLLGLCMVMLPIAALIAGFVVWWVRNG